MCAPSGRVLRVTRYGLRMRQSKVTAKGKLEGVPRGSDSDDSETVSPWVCPCVYPHILYIFPLLINTSLSHHFPSVWKVFSAQLKGQGPGLGARIWSFRHQDPAHLWLGTQALLQVIAGQGHLRSLLVYKFLGLRAHPLSSPLYFQHVIWDSASNRASGSTGWTNEFHPGIFILFEHIHILLKYSWSILFPSIQQWFNFFHRLYSI